MQRNLQPAIDLIKAFEGIMDGDSATVNLDPYLCPAGYWTIGWGHVVLDPRGNQIKGMGSKKQACSIYPHGITKAEAEVLLADDVRRFASGVEQSVKVDINGNQFCALVSLAFNIGFGAFKGSTMLKLANYGEIDTVPGQFMRWNKVKIDGVKKESAGLTRRRKAEVMLWEKLP